MKMYDQHEYEYEYVLIVQLAIEKKTVQSSERGGTLQHLHQTTAIGDGKNLILIRLSAKDNLSSIF